MELKRMRMFSRRVDDKSTVLLSGADLTPSWKEGEHDGN
jgi:hypothetical protein